MAEDVVAVVLADLDFVGLPGIIQGGDDLSGAEEIAVLGGLQGLLGGEDGEIQPEHQHHQDNGQQQNVPEDAAFALGGGDKGSGHIKPLLSAAGSGRWRPPRTGQSGG